MRHGQIKRLERTLREQVGVVGKDLTDAVPPGKGLRPVSVYIAAGRQPNLRNQLRDEGGVPGNLAAADDGQFQTLHAAAHASPRRSTSW